MDIEAILKEYNSMMKKQTSLQPMKTFKNEKLSDSKSPDAKTRRDKLALQKQHSVYMMEPTKQKKQENLVEEEEKVTGKVTLADYKNYLATRLASAEYFFTWPFALLLPSANSQSPISSLIGPTSLLRSSREATTPAR